MTTLHWQKSSFSSGDLNTTCVEIADGAHHLHLRESENPGVVLTPHRAALRSLLAHVKARGAAALRT